MSADQSEPSPLWWKRFGDPAINQLVEDTVGDNFQIKAALARLRQSRFAANASRGDRFPSIGLNASASGQDRGDAGAFVPGIGGGGGGTPLLGSGGDDFIELYDLSIDVSWQVDLFGRLARLNQAADLDKVATGYDALALAHTLVAQTIRTRVALATLDDRLNLAEANLHSLQETLTTVDGRYEAGVGDPVQLRLARENVATAEAALPSLRAELASTQYALAVLTGRPPTQAMEILTDLPDLPPLALPPIGLPATLLDRRPDLLASEFRYRADQARVGASIAALFPNLTLNGSAGTSAGDAGDLFDSGTFVYSIIGSLAQPIFQGGSLRARVRQSEATVEAAAATYANDVLEAMREANEALVREQYAREEAAAVERALEEATAAETLARDRFGQGVGDLLSVFEAERRRRAAEERLALTRQAVWNARVNLHLALGGDWTEGPTPPIPAVNESDGQD